MVAYACRSVFPTRPETAFGYSEGPDLVDVLLLNLSDPSNSAIPDPNGCSAMHPSATHAVRLFFSSPVVELASGSAAVSESSPGTNTSMGRATSDLVPFGTNAAAAAAVFSLFSGDGDVESPDTVVGVADVDDDNVIDVCIRAADTDLQVRPSSFA